MLLSRRALTGRLDLRSEPLAAIYVRGFIHQMSPAAFMRIPSALSDPVGRGRRLGRPLLRRHDPQIKGTRPTPDSHATHTALQPPSLRVLASVFLGLVPLDIDFQEVDLPSLGQSGTARALRRAGRELVERQFTDGIVARETLALYRAALAGRHGFPAAREIPGKPSPTDAKST